MTYDETKDIADEFCEPVLRYQDGLRTSMKGSDFIFHLAQLVYYKCHKENLSRDGSTLVIQTK